MDSFFHFITLNTNGELKLLISPEYYRIVFDSFTFINKKYKASLIGYVVLPNQVQFITMFSQKSKISDYVENFKTFTRNEIVRLLERDQRQEILAKIKFTQREQKYKVWMTGFEDIILKDKEGIKSSLEEIHFKPIDLDLIKIPEEYMYSSAKYYLNNQPTEIKLADYKNMNLDS